MRLLYRMPGINRRMKKYAYDKVMQLMGGKCYEILIGGASFSPEIENFFTTIGFPITVGYGTTETGPMITYSDHKDFVPGSCGTAAWHMEVKIDSPSPTNIPGEILTRGLNVMSGYYKDEAATSAVIDKEGWFHTGDLGQMSADGHVFILGRMKNMLLGSNGQNIYPEEIENKLNGLVLVIESLVLQKGNKLVALVHADIPEAKKLGLTDAELKKVMDENLKILNNNLPSFSRISRIVLHPKEFEKTSKGSIKRYLYKDSI